MSPDPFNLRRFIFAQEPIYDQVVSELRAGRKRSHWIWFIFPQMAGLGHSAMARRFAIYNLDEAKAYLSHSVLGARLIECTDLIIALKGKSIDSILGYPDNIKFRSSMTLFAAAARADDNPFNLALKLFFEGERDKVTGKLLT